MKSKQIILLIIFFTLIIITTLVFNKKANKTNTVAIESSNGTYCFTREQLATTQAPYAVSEKVTLEISDNVVSGTKEGTQSGPDMTNGFEGTLTGTKNDTELELVYSYTVEGSQNKELEIYELKDKDLVKKRWVLKEEGDILVPDKSTEPTLIQYERAVCRNVNIG